MPGFEVKFCGPKRRRRLRFERESTGGWRRTHQEFRDGRWRTVGQTLVNDVSVEMDDGALDALDVIFRDNEPDASTDANAKTEVFEL